MKLAKRDIRVRGALAVIALIVIGSVVGGRDQRAAATSLPQAPSGEPARALQTAARAAQESLTDLDMGKLRRQNWSDGVSNLLGPRSAAVPTQQVTGRAEPAVTPPPPPAPTAPPLPFTYIGKIVDGGRTTVFVGRGADHYEAQAGAEIEQYKVERVTDTQITFVFRPLGTRQVLDVPQPGQ